MQNANSAGTPQDAGLLPNDDNAKFWNHPAKRDAQFLHFEI